MKKSLFWMFALLPMLLTSCDKVFSSSTTPSANDNQSVQTSVEDNKSDQQASGSVHTHSYESKTTAPTCTQSGFTVYTCSCGDNYIGDYIDALGHDYSIEHKGEASTCIKHGHTSYLECSRCGTLNGYEELPYADHNWVYHSAKTPSCYEKGWNEYKVCTVCGKSTYEELPATHTPGDYVVVTEPTCTQAGVEAQYCTICNKQVNTRSIAALGHSYDANGVCTRCDGRKPTPGIACTLMSLTSTGENVAVVSGIGTATATDIVLPIEYNGYRVVAVYNEAFANNTNITSVYIPGYEVGLCPKAFANCTNLKTVTFAGSMILDTDAFDGCNKLIKVNVTKIEYWLGMTFDAAAKSPLSSGTTGLYVNDVIVQDLVVPEGVTYISYFTFYNYKYLKSVTLPSTLKSIYWGCFTNCSNLTSMTFSSANTIFEEIQSYAFYSCTSLTSVALPDSTKTLGQAVFYDCSSLSSATIGKSVTTIEGHAFAFCRSLKSITIPSSVDCIEAKAFAQSGLEEVTFENTTGWIAGINNLESSDLADKKTAATYLRNTYYDSKWVRM